MPTSKKASSAGEVPNVTAEFFTLAGLAAASALGVRVGEKTYQLMKSPEPLVVQILDSVVIKDEHRVTLKVTNQTLHGTYLERLEITKPEGLTPKFYLRETERESGMLSHSAWVEHKVGECFPKHVAPGSDTSFAFSLPLLKQEDFVRAPYGICSLHFSRLEERKIDGKEIVFRLRW